ncbi:MAG TPA: hypothetical protein VD907_02470 [Verrucomicrobiae bacterium]|nr:hypothetical protein [Verrucomicrobiae bacterium]
MSEAAEVLVIILSVFLAIFLALAITLTIMLIKVTKKIDKVAESARTTAEHIERGVIDIATFTSPSFLAKFISRLFRGEKDSTK